MIFDWLDSNPPQPFFLFTNFIDPHGPYRPPTRLKQLFQSGKKRILSPEQIPPSQILKKPLNYYDYVDAYDREIRYTDETLAVLIKKFKAKGLWDDSFVIFLADHGEAMGEQGYYFAHGHNLAHCQIHVPFILKDVDGGSGLRTDEVQHLDIVPTVLQSVGIPLNLRYRGRDLRKRQQGCQRFVSGVACHGRSRIKEPCCADKPASGIRVQGWTV